MTYTTNEEDQREVARLQARLAEEKPSSTSISSGVSAYKIPSVTIDEGAHKYVLISALTPGGDERQHFVVSRRGAQYHCNAAEPMVEAMERSGYTRISIMGGGRIELDNDKKMISIYGYSYGFGLVRQTRKSLLTIYYSVVSPFSPFVEGRPRAEQIHCRKRFSVQRL